MTETALEPVETDEPEQDEPATGDDPEQEQDETSDEPEQDTPTGAEALQAAPAFDPEKVGKQLEGLQKHVARRMGEIFGEDAQAYELCDLCTFYGTPGWRISGPLREEVTTQLRHVMGFHAPTDYRRSEFTRRCDVCDGLTKVQSGSQDPQYELLSCPACGGKGYQQVGTPPLAVVPPAVPVPPNGAQTTTTPTVILSPEPPEVAELKAKGYIVVPPTPIPG